MTKNKILIVAMSFIMTLPLTAQRYNSGWDLGIGGGAQLLFSSDVENLAFKQRLTPSLSLSAGKWITPLWGLRLQAGAYSLNGYSTTEGLYLANPLDNGLIYGNNDPVRDHVTIYPDGSYRHYIRYANIHADLQLSLLKLINKHKCYKWDIIPSAGLGYFRTFEYKGVPAVNSISSNFSLMGKYSINEKLDVNLELSTVVLPGAFEGRITGKTYENTLGATLGLTYHFKKKKTVPEQIQRVEPEVRIEIQRDTIIEHVRDTVEVKVEVEKYIKIGTEFRLASIQFELAREKPLAGQDIQFANIVNYLATHPEARIVLEGYGDKEHGSAEENRRISSKRVKNVGNILVSKYNIDVNRIEIKAIGSQEQPYEKQTWNRVVIVKAVE